MNYDLILNIAIIVLVVGAIVFLYYKGKKKEALKIIAFLVEVAEKKYGSGTGEFKYNYVTTKLYPALPSLIRGAVSPNTLDKWIEGEVNKLQEHFKN